MAVIAWLFADVLDLKTIAALALVAWVGQLLVVLSGVVAEYSQLPGALLIWLYATGGLLQPIAAFVGGWVGLRLRASQQSTAD